MEYSRRQVQHEEAQRCNKYVLDIAEQLKSFINSKSIVQRGMYRRHELAQSKEKEFERERERERDNREETEVLKNEMDRHMQRDRGRGWK
jgi:hypothetical protein